MTDLLDDLEKTIKKELPNCILNMNSRSIIISTLKRIRFAFGDKVADRVYDEYGLEGKGFDRHYD